MKARIHQPTKTATQSGRKTNNWFLEPIIEEQYKSNDNLMGWTSSGNAMSQIKLEFNNLQDAVKYAVNLGWSYKIILPQITHIRKKSYADNFL